MWKYGLIKVEYPDLWEDEEGYYELVELYHGGDYNYVSFCRANINSIKELENAYNDVKEDGPNLWFAENGKFSWNTEKQFWDWKKVNDGRS